MIKLKKLREDDFAEIENWFLDDVFQRRLEGYYPVRKQLDLLIQSKTQFCWIIEEGAEKLGLLELEIENPATANILIALKASARGQGKCKQALSLLDQIDILDRITLMNAYISRDNAASIKCFESAGFHIEAEKDAFVQLIKYR